MQLDGLYDPCKHCNGSGVEPNKFDEMQNLISELKHDRNIINGLLSVLVGNEDSRILLHSIGNSSPIMQWAKDINGVYTYMNQALCDHLYYGSPKDLIGLDDIQIIAKHLETYPNHNFGSICMGTDKLVVDADKPMRFNEWGIVRDKFQYVVAYKNTYKDEQGKILGSCGLAIYVTEEVEEIISIMESITDENTKVKLAKYLGRYGFGQNDVFSDINISELWKKGVV
jgi:PAS domain-containing protein